MKYKRIYEMLKGNGHSPIKAAEIIIDAKRGDAWSLYWIRIVRKVEIRKKYR